MRGGTVQFYVGVSLVAVICAGPIAGQSQTTSTSPDEPPVALITRLNVWRFNQQNVDLGTSWKERDYDDRQWESGPGPFGFPITEFLPDEPIRTVLNGKGPAPNTNAIRTYYFRTRFTFTNDPGGVMLTLSSILDDGAVFYLNGKEVGRFGMPAGAIDWQTSSIRNGEAGGRAFDILFLSMFDVLPGENVLTAEVHQSGTSSDDIVFGTTLSMKRVPPDATVLIKPQDQFVYVGTSVVFTANVLGARPMSFQWQKDGIPISGATNLSYALGNVNMSDSGAYALVVSNSFNSVRSSPGNLVVLTTPPLELVHFTNVWKYDDLFHDLGSTWRLPAYDDTAWRQNPLLGIFVGGPGSSDVPEQRGWFLAPIDGSQPLTPQLQTLTCYFRARFLAAEARSPVTLIFVNLLDDGAVFYLNGAELFRTRIPLGPLTYGTLADPSPVNGREYEVSIVPNVRFLPGENVLAVELHQESIARSDTIFGTRMLAVLGPDEPAAIVREPQNLSASLGSRATFAAEVFGSGPLFLQWLKDGAPIAGATNNFLTFPSVRLEDSGRYEIQVSNRHNAATSRAVFLDTFSPATLAFQHGVNGYTGAVDTTLRRDLPNNNLNGVANVFVGPGVGNSFGQGLIRFENIFGIASNQIPPGATILSARMVLRTPSNSSTNAMRFHRMLRPWAAADTWNTLSNGITADDMEALSVFDASFTPAVVSGGSTLDVTPALNSWSEGNSNNGWAILTTGPDGWSMDSSEVTPINYRPQLIVSFAPPGTAIPLAILSPPRSQDVFLGTNLTLTVGVTGSAPKYVWFKNGTAIPGATNHGLAFANFQFSDAGVYRVVITNSLSSVTSAPVTLTVTVPEALITITRQPRNETVFIGGAVSLDIDVLTQLPAFFQWRKDGFAIPGATNRTYVVSNVRVSDAGAYTVVVSNSFYSVTSNPALLMLAEALELVSFSNIWRYSASGRDLGPSWMLTNDTSGSWKDGRGLFVTGAPKSPEPAMTVLPLFDSSLSPVRTFYFQTRFVAPETHGPVSLIFLNLLQPGAVFYLNGAELFRKRIPPGPVTYGTGAEPSGESGTRDEVVVVSAATLSPGENVLSVEVHQESGSLNHIVFGSRVVVVAGTNEPARIVTQPLDTEVLLGLPAAFTATVFGSAPLHLQWLKDGELISGETNTYLHFATTTLDDSGNYELQVSNRLGTATSRAVQLLVTNAPFVVVRGPYLQNGTPNSVIVRWRTSAPSDSRVSFGTNLSGLNGSVADAALKIDHELQLAGLSANTHYYYAVGNALSNLAIGQEFSFRTPPLTAKPTRIWAQGDSGTGGASLRTRLLEGVGGVVNAFTNFNGGRSPDVWLMLGDNAYGSGKDSEYQQAVFDFMPDLLRRTLLWSTIGNHETYSSNGFGLFPYLDIFSPPIGGEAGGVPSGTKLYYSFDYGNIHFVCLDSEVSSSEVTGAMATWLQQDLTENSKDWLIAFWHSPPYSKGSHNSDGERALVQMRENIVPILELHGVDLVLCGHSHNYERSFLLDGHYGLSSTLNPSMLKDAGTGHDSGTGGYRKTNTGPAPREGAVYVVAGSSGQITALGTLNHPAMAVSLLRLGSMVIDINGNRLDALFLRETGAVDDRFTILKGTAPESLRVASFRVAGGKVYGAWKSVAGRRYEVQTSTAIYGSPWQRVGNVVEATGATSFWTGDVVAGATLFYRVAQIGE